MLGPFEITGPLGAGAMGTVWQGVHRDHRRPVAIKVLRAEFVHDPKYLEAFHREVRAIARLTHPGIVKIYDYGAISPQAADHYQDLQAGSLWLAMEFARGGSLEEGLTSLTWADLKVLLLQTLDALAHAHARDLVHRDLKPANILYQPAGDGGHRRWLLSDFGIAHIQDPTFGSHTAEINATAAGTPHFMSPEQLHGHWRDYGPWTDLYALGCVAYLLSCGRPPFEADSVMAIAIKHLSDPVPPIDPLLALPPGFENWLHQLLAKDIAHRYRRAADAAADLLRLGDPDPSMAPDQPGIDSFSTGPTVSFETLEAPPTPMPTLLLEAGSLQAIVAADRRQEAPENPATSVPPSRRLITSPTSWRQAGDLRPPATIPATGKGIFGLRQPPYVGREDCRDLLWDELRQVCETQRPRLILIRGPAGIGKSSLMNWLTTRAHELGLANSMVATHSPIMNPNDGLPHTFRAYLGATELQRSTLYQRLRHVYTNHLNNTSIDHDHLAAVVEWLAPRDALSPPDDDIPVIDLQTPLERYLVIEQLLAHLAQPRPIILGIDDAHWSQDSLAFARHLLTRQEHHPLPALLIATLRPSALDNRLVEQELLELLYAQPATTVVDLDRMNAADQRQLVELLLGLEQSLIDAIAHRSRGVPLFALQLIEDWVSQDALVESDEGYILADHASFPDTLEDLIELRLAQFVDSWAHPQQARQALEFAAALGIDIDRQEWRTIYEAHGVDLDDAFVDHMMVHGIAVPHRGGWRFRLPLYRDIIEATSRRHHRWSLINSVVADAVDTAPSGTCLSERRARHLLAAHRRQEALPLFWRAVDDRMNKSAYIQARALLRVIEQIYDDLGVDDDDHRRQRLLISRVETYRYRGNIQTGRSILGKLLTRPELLSPLLLANAHRVAANYANIEGAFAASLKHYQTAHDLFESIDDRRGVCRCLDGMGWIHLSMGDLPQARQAYARGYETALEEGLTLEAAWCLRGVAEIAFLCDDPSGEADAQQALALFDRLGCRSGMGVTHRILGDFAREAGDIDRARTHYARAQHLGHMIGHLLANFSIPLFALCDLAEGDLPAARQRFEGYNKILPADAASAFGLIGDMGLLIVAARQFDGPQFDAIADRMEPKLNRMTPLKREYIHLLNDAVAAWQSQGDAPRRARAQQFLEIFL